MTVVHSAVHIFFTCDEADDLADKVLCAKVLVQGRAVCSDSDEGRGLKAIDCIMSSFAPKQYGLILKKKPGVAAAPGGAKKPLSVFGADEDSEEESAPQKGSATQKVTFDFCFTPTICMRLPISADQYPRFFHSLIPCLRTHLQAKADVNKQLMALQAKQQVDKSVQKAMEEDPNAFAYDEVFAGQLLGTGIQALHIVLPD